MADHVDSFDLYGLAPRAERGPILRAVADGTEAHA